MKRVLIAFALAAVCTSCMVGPNYAPPCPPDEEWISDEPKTFSEEPICIDWWNTFEDPLLTELVEEAAYSNLTIQEAEARVYEARALRKIATAPLFPWFGASADYLSFQESLNAPLGVGFLIDSGLADRENEVYDVNFDAFWELDIFGGKRRGVEASCARVGGAIASKRDVLLSMIAETARNYFELRGFQKRLALLKQNASLQEQTLDLVRKKEAIGLAREVDVTRAEALLENTRAQIPNLEGSIQTTSYRIAVLTGREPGALYSSLSAAKPLVIPDDIIPIGIRSDILRRRPDVQYAERQLAAATADIGVSVARLFPSVTLRSDYGYLTTQTISSLISGNSVTWLFDTLIHQPLFEGGRLLADVQVKQALQSQAALSYQNTVLTALEEAESSLVRFVREQETRRLRLAEVKAADHSAELLRNLYEKGLTDFLDVLVAEREQTSAADHLAQSETLVLINLVALFKSLGGGWEGFECPVCCDPDH